MESGTAHILKLLRRLPADEVQGLLRDLEHLQEAEKLQEAREKFLPFVRMMWPSFIEGEHFKIMAAAFERVVDGDLKRLAIHMPPRFGKLCADSTPVLTTKGWKRHGDLAVGDMVFGINGMPTEVVAVGAPDLASLEVEFVDGARIKVHPQHEWTVYDRSYGKWKTVETAYLLRQNVWSGNRGSSQVASRSALQFCPQNLLVSPYALGAWLGDGTSGKGCLSHAEDKSEIVTRFVANGYPISTVCVHPTTGVSTTYFAGPRPGVIGLLGGGLQKIGVYRDKHIPDVYKMASVTQRLELLAGLIDTDGSVDRNSRVSISTASSRLASDIVELVRSFGWHATRASVAPSLSSSGIQGRKPVFYICFQPDMHIPVALERKAIRRFVRKRRISIRSIKPCSPEIGRCIEVAAHDGQYLVGEHLTPTHNSQSASYFLPAWFIGKYPDKKIIQSSHTAELAVGFGRKVKNLLSHPDYQKVFPGVALTSDSKAAGRWTTNKGGEYFAIGTGGAIAGKGADLYIVDDAVSEQEALSGDPTVYDKVYEWYVTGPRQRLQPGARILNIMTRWSKRDLSARLIKAAENDPMADQWEVIEFPAIMPDGRSLWPEYWPIHALQQTKAVMPPHRWQATYQQSPTSAEGALVKPEWWRLWERTAPRCEYVIQSWDTAYGKDERSNPSACTTWGLFKNGLGEDRDTRLHIFLLDAFAERMPFPTLKARAMDEYKRWNPDMVIVEAKASGMPLVTELRMAGLPVEEYSPARGNDKTVRVNSVSDLFQGGMIWAPDARYANEVKTQFADFPAGEYDDLVDSSTQALLRLRQGGFVRMKTDFDDKDDKPQRRRKADYY